MLSVTVRTRARIHWKHNFNRRAPRVAGNDNARNYWADVRAALLAQALPAGADFTPCHSTPSTQKGQRDHVG